MFCTFLTLTSMFLQWWKSDRVGAGSPPTPQNVYAGDLRQKQPEHVLIFLYFLCISFF